MQATAMRMPTRRQPPEWMPHDACWLAWPSHPHLWGEDLTEVRRAFVELCRAIGGSGSAAEGGSAERLEVLVLDERGEQEVAEALPSARTHRVPFGDIWLRDTAPVFVRDEDGSPRAVRFVFNGWGGKYRLPGDDALAAEVARIAEVPLLEVGLVAEGGALEVDGLGTCLTTRQCLLNANRNPGVSEEHVERYLGVALGVTKVVWLDEGLANDHTDGHVDNIARFVGPGRVVCAAPARGDPNLDVLQKIKRELAEAKDATGRSLEVVELPSPGPIFDAEGAAMPAGYLNFYVGNGAVVVPVYGKPTDGDALSIIEDCFPGRRVVGVDATAILRGGGAFHCITQQQPRAAEDGERKVP